MPAVWTLVCASAGAARNATLASAVEIILGAHIGRPFKGDLKGSGLKPHSDAGDEGECFGVFAPGADILSRLAG